VSSAGFFGSDRPVPDVALALAWKRGFDLSRHRSRPLLKRVVDHADIVIVMDRDQARQLAGLFPGVSRRIVLAGDLDPRFDSSRGITDPWNKRAKVFESSFERLERCASTLIDLIRRRETSSRTVRATY
jgi:protein-tyrosine-phosphatase